MKLKHKETGDMYEVVHGVILSPSEAVKKDATASFVTLRSINGDEFVGAVIGYTREGYYSSANAFELIHEEENT